MRGPLLRCSARPLSLPLPRGLGHHLHHIIRVIRVLQNHEGLPRLRRFLPKGSNRDADIDTPRRAQSPDKRRVRTRNAPQSYRQVAWTRRRRPTCESAPAGAARVWDVDDGFCACPPTGDAPVFASAFTSVAGTFGPAACADVPSADGASWARGVHRGRIPRWAPMLAYQPAASSPHPCLKPTSAPATLQPFLLTVC